MEFFEVLKKRRCIRAFKPEVPPRQKLDKMMREAQRMRRIIENLLRFARPNLVS